MKTEPKPFASLSSGLLARKGAARPAMRPQGFGGQIGGGLEDLGWDDMGFEPPKPTDSERDSEHDAFGEELTSHPSRNPLAALTPIASPVHDQQAEIEDRLTGDEEDSEEFDETAELYDPEAQTAPSFAVATVPTRAPRRPPAGPAPAPCTRRCRRSS